MDWLKELLEKATITDGKLDVVALMELVKVEFPKHVVPKKDYNDKVTELKTANDTIADLKTAAENIKKEYALKEKLTAAGVLDADYIIYNSTVDGELKSRDELLTKSQLLENFKAVQNGNVYCTTQNIYQSTMELGTIIADIHNMLQGDDQSLTYIYKLE